MEELILKNTITMLGIMFAAIIGGLFSLVNLVSSKEQKVSEFRQKWIDSLRDSISSYIASLYYVSYLIENRPLGKNRYEVIMIVDKSYLELNKMYNDIIFRINHDEKNKKYKEINDEFIAELSESRRMFNDNLLEDARISCEKIRTLSKPLLKIEWERVKSGEPAYRRSKYFALIILVIGMFIFSYSSYRIIGTVLNSKIVIDINP